MNAKFPTVINCLPQACYGNVNVKEYEPASQNIDMYGTVA